MDILSKLVMDMPDAGLKCNSVYGSTSLYTVPAELSLCVTLKITAEQYAQMSSGALIGCPNGTSWFMLGRRTGWNEGFWWYYKNANLPEESGYESKVGYYNSVMSTILDGKPHKLVCCIGNRTKDGAAVETYSDKGLKFFLDGVAVADGIGGRNKQFLNTTTEFNATNSFRFGVTSTYTLDGGGIISNVKYFNFDISADGAAYTLEDYQNDKDVPNFSYLLSPSIYNTIVWGYPAWYDTGFTVKSANGEYLTTTHTGADTSQSLNILTFNNSGYKIKFKKFHFRVDDIRHNLANAAEQNTVPKWFWVGFTYVDAAGTTQNIRIYNNSQFTSSDFPVVLDYDIPEDWQYITRINICSDFKNGTTAITEGDTVVYKNLRVWVEDFESINYPEAYLKKLSNGKVLELANKLSGTTWQDESGNGYDMALQGDFEIVDI